MHDIERSILMDISEPDQGVIDTLSQVEGDLLLLGAGGKIGHGISLMAKRAFDAAGKKNRVLAVSRYSNAASRKVLEDDGITTVACDLGDTEAVQDLPDASHIVYLAGQKFGTAAGQQATTWLLNTVVPGVVAQRWRDSKLAVYSSGNVYPFSPVTGNGPDESVEPAPIGEYAQSVLGRERIFEYFSRHYGTPVTTIRLNYANEPRYGIIVDIATKILNGQPVDVTMGYVNLIWQGDCNRVTLRCFDIASTPPQPLNLAGPKIAQRDLAQRIAKAMGKNVTITGTEAPNALLSDGSFCWNTFGPAQVDIDEMIRRVCKYLNSGGATWGKPTHFEVRDGKF
jgi:nucleoside-diphosphate-sugar epimerase